MKIKILILSILLSVSVHAGVNNLTHHSRANCVNNETISWDWTANHWLRVDSYHDDARTGGNVHYIMTSWQNTWRQAAVHYGEGTHGWAVRGNHWMIDRNGSHYIAASEYVTDCSIYDGWWDRNK